VLSLLMNSNLLTWNRKPRSIDSSMNTTLRPPQIRLRRRKAMKKKFLRKQAKKKKNSRQQETHKKA
jgi:hypothetical protein